MLSPWADSEQDSEMVIGRPSPSLLSTSPASAQVQAMATAMLSRPSLKPLWVLIAYRMQLPPSHLLSHSSLPFSQQVVLGALKETGLYCSPSKQLLLT